MRNYTVLAPPLPGSDAAPEALRLVFVKDGFCWPALLVTLPWMLYRRLFIEAAVYVVAMAALAAIGARTDLPVGVLALALGLGLGVLGNDLRRFALGRRGYVLRGSATGRSLDEAEIRYFLGLPSEAEPAASPPAPMPAKLAPAAPGPVIGLFPTAEGTR